MVKKGVFMMTETVDITGQVQEVLEKLRPFLLRDGGDVELVDIEDGIVKVRLMALAVLALHRQLR